jgi:dolichol-phosphate mannosyltransferase
MSGMRLISVVAPAMNEEETIDKFYEAVKAVTDDLTHYEWEFIFINDGSTDHTSDRILALREQDPRVRLLELSRNYGSYNAIRAGFDHARGDAVISISTDLQDPPELFRSFVAGWEAGHHIVWGVRQQRDDPLLKTLLARMFYSVIRRLALKNLPANGMDCGLFDRKVIEAFRQIPDRNAITFMTIYWTGFRQMQVGYHRRARERGTSKWPFAKRMNAALDVITAFSPLPIRFISVVGLVTLLVGLVGLCGLLFSKLVLGTGEWGMPLLLIGMLVVGGLQMLMLGGMGEYVWRIAAEVRGLPRYLIMRSVGFEEQAVPGTNARSNAA